MIDQKNLPKASDYPLLLDGGLSNQLEAMGYDLNDPLWSARLLKDDPEAIVEAHLAYLRSGAQILITSSYQSSIEGFAKTGLSELEAVELILRSVELAKEASKRFQNDYTQAEKIFIAGSIGPYGAFLADGSEYTGNYTISEVELIDFHFKRIQILADSSADFLACETIPSIREAHVLHALLSQSKKPAWVSFSCFDNTYLNDGTPASEAFRLFRDHPNVFALGINCTAPQYVSGLIGIIREEAPGKKIVVYPNSGEIYNPETKGWAGTNDPLICGMMSNEWLQLGADIIGGCCRIGPKHIAAIGAMIDSNQ